MTTTKTTKTITDGRMTLATLLFLVTLTAACDRTARLETRTFQIHNLEPGEAMQLVDPYVYGDRPGAPGGLSAIHTAITVRETPDNLERIARVLEEFDVARSDVRLRFQLIEADGFTESDPAIAEVEEELRKIFQFRGYRLAGEAVVAATDRSRVAQVLTGSEGRYEVTAEVYWAQPGTMRLQDVRFYSQTGGGAALSTTVNIRSGQTLVLGSSAQTGSTATLLLTVKAEAVDGSGL